MNSYRYINERPLGEFQDDSGATPVFRSIYANVKYHYYRFYCPEKFYRPIRVDYSDT